MGNRKKAIKINPERVKTALHDSGISINQLAQITGMSDRHLRRAINERKELQRDLIEEIASLTQTAPSELIDPYITLTSDKDIYDSHGRMIFKKGDSVAFPKIGSDCYLTKDLKEWDKMTDKCLRHFGIGKRLHMMKKKEKEDFCTYFESWIMIANKYYGSLTEEQEITLLDTVEAIADKMVEKNSQRKGR